MPRSELPMSYEERWIELLKVRCQQAVNTACVQDAYVDVLADQAGRLVASLTAHVWAEKLADHQNLWREYVPASWWDHLKHTLPWPLWRFWNLYVWRLKVPHMRVLELRCNWQAHLAYPQARPPLPPEKFGLPVLWQQERSSAGEVEG